MFSFYLYKNIYCTNKIIVKVVYQLCFRNNTYFNNKYYRNKF